LGCTNDALPVTFLIGLVRHSGSFKYVKEDILSIILHALVNVQGSVFYIPEKLTCNNQYVHSNFPVKQICTQ
jgi:hypothetical protein